MTKRQRNLTGSIVLLAIALFCVLLYLKLASDTGPGARKMPPVVVKLATATPDQWQTEIAGTGTLSAFNGIWIDSEVAGRITDVHFSSGIDVKKGQLLLTIYPDIIAADLKRAETKLAYSTSDFNRKAKLYERKVLSGDEYDKAKATMDGDKASVLSYKAQLAQHYVRAPFSGRLGLKQVDLGDYLDKGTQIVNLEALDPLRVEFRIPQAYLSQLAVGQQVEITAKAYSDKTFTGTIYAFDSGIDPETRTIGARAKVPNPNKLLMPGTYVDVKVFAGKKQPVLVVPQTAINYAPSGDTVYLDKKGVATKQKVTVGQQRGDSIAVLSGLKAGDSVISAGQVKLAEGDKIMTQEQWDLFLIKKGGGEKLLKEKQQQLDQGRKKLADKKKELAAKAKTLKEKQTKFDKVSGKEPAFLRNKQAKELKEKTALLKEKKEELQEKEKELQQKAAHLEKMKALYASQPKSATSKP